MANQEEKRLVSAEQVIIDEFIKDLEATANQVQELLTEIRDSKIDLATIKTEFKFVAENVKQLFQSSNQKYITSERLFTNKYIWFGYWFDLCALDLVMGSRRIEL